MGGDCVSVDQQLNGPFLFIISFETKQPYANEGALEITISDISRILFILIDY